MEHDGGLEHRLLGIEERFWSGDEDFYRAHLDAECLLAFPELARAMTCEEVVDTVSDSHWSQLVIEKVGFRRLGDAGAVLTYRAQAKRASGEPYHALVSSAYVRRDDGWKLAFHQQTPLPT